MSQNKDPLTPVLLKNGDRVARMAVETVMLPLDRIFNDAPLAFYELAASCRDKEHVLWSGTAELLIEFGLIEAVNNDGTAQIHDIVRSVVQSAVEGEETELRRVPPIKADN